MLTVNSSSLHPSFFLLIGIPGLEAAHTAISIPLCVMYLIALLGNSTVIFIIIREHSLHKPMYIFLSMLAATDLILCSCTVPRVLTLFWFHIREISFGGCLAQMFLIHFSFILESAILLAMAFDRYVAICNPLQYEAILPISVIIKIGVSGVVRSICSVSPFIYLLMRLSYCETNIIPHTYCEHMGVALLACADITVNIMYGLTIGVLTVLLDFLLIIVSYGLILWTVIHLPSAARLKAFSTCASHVCVILMFYIPAFITVLAHRFGHKSIPSHIHILLANLYVVFPPMLNPIIYGVKTREIRKRVQQTLGLISDHCDPRSSQQ
ncbi:olfactory receptor 52Z1-like [Rhinatrema bivittatum]|uniref:olfactory receptor 52Z1-like n=1 Tax=Rhinatrema bivittatum TaxID=194408 RepID=UPI001128721B|nr:olfactory receptor 52Z1-like [Rhinatrema bivittatum]